MISTYSTLTPASFNSGHCSSAGLGLDAPTQPRKAATDSARLSGGNQAAATGCRYKVSDFQLSDFQLLAFKSQTPISHSFKLGSSEDKRMAQIKLSLILLGLLLNWRSGKLRQPMSFFFFIHTLAS